MGMQHRVVCKDGMGNDHVVALEIFEKTCQPNGYRFFACLLCNLFVCACLFEFAGHQSLLGAGNGCLLLVGPCPLVYATVRHKHPADCATPSGCTMGGSTSSALHSGPLCLCPRAAPDCSGRKGLLQQAGPQVVFHAGHFPLLWHPFLCLHPPWCQGPCL